MMGDLRRGPGYRYCSRSACTAPAKSSLGFDYSARRAWLEDLKMPEDPHFYDLCDDHADRFTPPSGWERGDLRAPSKGAPDHRTASLFDRAEMTPATAEETAPSSELAAEPAD